MSAHTASTDFESLKRASFAKLPPFDWRFELSTDMVNVRVMRQFYGAHPAVEQHFQRRKDRFLDTKDTDQSVDINVKVFREVFQDINNEYRGCFGGGNVVKFLDLGCSPGGFSSWLLDHNIRATGVGVTLSDDDAPFRMTSLGAHRRYHLKFRDILDIVEDCDPVIQAENARERVLYDLVIAGAFSTLQDSNYSPLRHTRKPRLVLAQLWIALSNLAPNGSLIMVINTRVSLWIIEVVRLLKSCFEVMGTGKGVHTHSTRSSCYLVCRGFREEERLSALNSIHPALTRLDEKYTLPPPVDGEDRQRSDFPPILSDCDHNQIFAETSTLVLSLFEPIWRSQLAALRSHLEHLSPNDEGLRHILSQMTLAEASPKDIPQSIISSAQRTRPRTRRPDNGETDGYVPSLNLTGPLPMSPRSTTTFTGAFWQAAAHRVPVSAVYPKVSSSAADTSSDWRTPGSRAGPALFEQQFAGRLRVTERSEYKGTDNTAWRRRRLD